MSDLTITNTFVSGNKITASSHNQNFSDVKNYINARNQGSTSWDNVNAVNMTVSGTLTLSGSLSIIPSGTIMVFYQASAPSGWTAVAQNDRFLRVVTAGTTGGTTSGSMAASTGLTHSHTVNSHTHGMAHTHAVGTTTGAIAAGADVYANTGSTGGVSTPNTGIATDNGTDTQLSGTFAAVDVILATKN
jgi:hypothetical protein